MKLEAQLTRELILTIEKTLPGSVVFKHSDRITFGVPDVSVTWMGTTTWIEIKRGHLSGRKIQQRTLQRLSKQTSAFYVVYYDTCIDVLTPDLKLFKKFDSNLDVAKLIRKLHVEAR